MSTVIAKNVQVGTSGTPAQNFTVYQPASPDGTVRVGNGNSGSVTDLLTLNSSGNLGLGVAPSAWQSTRKALQIGGTSSLHNVSNNTFVANNFYSDTSGTSRYLTTGVAQLFSQESDGGSKWYTAPSGTAGNAISFTQAMTLDASGRLSVPNQPAFRVNKSTVTNSTGTIVWNISNIDRNNNYNTANGRFTAPAGGCYQFNVFGVPNDGPGGSTLINFTVAVNGAATGIWINNGSTSVNASVSASFVLELTVGDYVTIVLAGGTMRTSNGDNNSFSGYFIG